MIAERVAAALLAADHRADLLHLRRHKLKPNANFDDVDAVFLPQDLQHPGGGQRLDDRPAIAAYFEQIERHQAIRPQLVDKDAVLVAQADTVRVAVVDDRHVRTHLLDPGQARVDIRRDRLGPVHLGEAWVGPAMHHGDRRLAAGQQLVEPAGAVAPHRVVDHGQPGGFDRLHVHQLADAAR